MKLTKLLVLLILGLGLCFTACKKEAADPCDSVVCMNGGTCSEGTCNCLSGFSGANCGTEDLCVTQSVNCLNGGTCVNEACDCPAGYTGVNCESLDLTEIQALLSAGIEPIDLYNSGAPLTALYGKTYKGGLIFHLNTVSGAGLVARNSDIPVSGDWGCLGTNTGASNVTSDPPSSGIETVNGARVGDGKDNTDSIIAGCNETTCAAFRCRDLSNVWSLPSRGELYLMYINLYINGVGNFTDGYYWSSTEYNSDKAWGLNFITGAQNEWAKTYNDNVRPIRSF